MAVQLYSYQDTTGATRYIGASSIEEAKKSAVNPATNATYSLVDGFSSAQGTASPDRVGEIAQQDFVTAENKQNIGSSFNLPSLNMTAAAQTPGAAPTQQQRPQERVGGFGTLSAALQEAVNLGRQQRQSAELDFLKGAIPKGAVSAGTFTGLLANLNRASTSFTQPIVDSVLEEASRVNNDIRENQNAIRELTLSMIDAGASQEAISTVLAFSETGDVDGALRAASGAFAGKSIQGGRKVEKVGSNLVSYDPNNPDDVQVMFAAPSSTGGGGTSSGQTTNTGFFNSGSIRIPDADLGELSIALNDSRGDDGYANTDTYVQAYTKWVQNGGLPQDFFKQFDPDNYLNPSDPTIPPQVRNAMTVKKETTSNPFAS